MKVPSEWKAASVNPPPEGISIGLMPITSDKLDQFVYA